MFLLGFFVFASVMLFYAAWEHSRQVKKRKLREWIAFGNEGLKPLEQTPLMVMTQIFKKIFGFIFPKGNAIEMARNRLNWAGWSKIEVEAYYTIRLLLFFIPSLIYPMVIGSNQLSYLFGIGAGFVLFMMPEKVVNQRIRLRNEKIEKELLPVTELLVTSTEAGLPLEQAINRITRVRNGYFSMLLRQGYQYMEGIMTREEAFTWMIKQTNVKSAHLFIESLMQTGQYGNEISGILREQLNRIRNEIQNKGIKRAQAVNGKMLIPTAIFIFIPLLVMILGPQIIAFRNM